MSWHVTVNLLGCERDKARGTGWARRRLCPSRNTGDLGPGPECLGPGGSVAMGWKVIAAEVDEVVDAVVGGEEALGLPGRLEALRRSRRRVDWWEFSALSFRLLCLRCSTEGSTSRLAAP